MIGLDFNSTLIYEIIFLHDSKCSEDVANILVQENSFCIHCSYEVVLF